MLFFHFLTPTDFILYLLLKYAVFSAIIYRSCNSCIVHVGHLILAGSSIKYERRGKFVSYDKAYYFFAF